MTDFTQKAKLSRLAVLASYFGLLLLLAVWHLWLYPTPTDNYWAVWVFVSLPLFAFGGVVAKGDPRGHAWFCFVLLFYVIGAVLSSFNPVTQLIGIIEGVLVGILFTAAMLYARWESRRRKQENA